MTHKQMVAVAKREIIAWEANAQRLLLRGLVLAILFAFIHRVTTGNTVEETFFQRSEPTADYEI